MYVNSVLGAMRMSLMISTGVNKQCVGANDNVLMISTGVKKTVLEAMIMS